MRKLTSQKSTKGIVLAIQMYNLFYLINTDLHCGCPVSHQAYEECALRRP